MRCLGIALIAAILLAVPHTAPAQTAPSPQAQRSEAYTLPPATLQKAISYSRVRTTLYFATTAWDAFVLLLILTFGVAYRMRNVALNLTRNRWAQGAIFLLQLLLVTSLLHLPLSVLGHHLAIVYGQSVQSWASWLGDKAKTLVLTWIIGLPLVMALFWTIRRSPRAWWAWFWLPAMAASVLGVFASPYILEPIFDKFQPLVATQPQLVARLELVAQHAGVAIPPSRMFLMEASAKVTGLNAYVTGLGASRRVVLWDTTVQHAAPNEVTFIFAHELGHYVLNHVPETLVFLAILLAVDFYLGYLALQWLLKRYGRVWRISTQQDWSVLVAILLVFSVLNFLTDPIANAFSRSIEHAADVYGLEAIHGIDPHPNQTAQATFQLLGQTSLVDPHPSPFVEFWTYSHPSIASRAAFARDYNPYAPGAHARYFPR